jgi:hypothetical protein
MGSATASPYRRYRADPVGDWSREARATHDLIEITPDRKLRINFHHGQARAWNATERIVAVVAGTQSGKTTFGPIWLRREMQLCGPGTYLVAAPSDPLLQVKLIPEFKRLFCDILNLGKFRDHPTPLFTLSKEGERVLWGAEQETETVVRFGYAAKPESLESMTVKAAWLDEAGQKEFKGASWEAVMRRLSLSMGRVLITTTPYTVGHWLKRKVFDKRHDPRESIRVVQFKSIENPQFPLEEWNRAKRELPRWKFRMFYCGEFARPAGQIYDVFDAEIMTIPRFPLPERWPRYGGADFGGVNMVGVYVAERPEDKHLFLYRTYKGGNRTAKEHAERMLRGEPRAPIFYGGSKSEDHWRLEFKAAGLRIAPPSVFDVEIGIDRVYSTMATGTLFVFDDLDDWIDEAVNYSREVDEEGNPLDAIADKDEYHLMDGTRYVLSTIRGGKRGSGYTVTHRSDYAGDEDDDDILDRQAAVYRR